MSDDLIRKCREGQPCLLTEKCRVMDAKSGCMCAEIADALEAAKRENDRLRRLVEAAEALHGCCLDCYQPTGECNCCRAALATDQKGGRRD
ncbi:hypothetical protein [Paracoccus sp. PAR01]|uniref:hypothetical protein n=1 Tax=Paracoccus sp. PAR01 TaxID=2769282 RepID=UPI0017832470|nr:hypothetical protein [Paracoccus sp. PAR01]MBD9529022.1 hypothetical protein [Paracoccus sp. PAR01]